MATAFEAGTAFGITSRVATLTLPGVTASVASTASGNSVSSFDLKAAESKLLTVPCTLKVVFTTER